MKILGEKSLSSATRIGLQVIFVVGCISLLVLPILLDWYTEYYNINISDFRRLYLIILYSSGLPALVIVYKFIKLFDTLKNNNPFVMENVKILKNLSIYTTIISIEYIIAVFVFRTVFTAVIPIIFVVATLALFILSELFKQAVIYKEENDLTI
jgi:hypothetical protein